MKCPNCNSAIEKVIPQSHGYINYYMCGSWETFLPGDLGKAHKSWACEEIVRLKKEVAHTEECYWIDRPRFFRD
jgi:hypothetical protein